MYLKVALLGSTLFFSGCSLFHQPKMPVQNKNLGIEVVEANTTVLPETNTTTVMPLGSDAAVQERNYKKKKKYSYLKPEPYSLESNEQDPELLGPQTTIASGLKREEAPLDRNSTN